MGSILTLGIDPPKNTSQRLGPDGITTFRFTDVWTPEGYLRFTFYRPYSPTIEPQTKTGFDAVIDHRVIVNLPSYNVEVQKFLQNPTINGFKLTIFDSGNMADIISSGKPLEQNITLKRLVNYKLFTRFIKPYYETNVYCQIEFKETGATDFELLTVGELDSVVEGDEKLLVAGKPNPNNKFLYTEGRDYLLHELVNEEYDSIRIFDLSFSHIGQTGLGKLKSKATPFVDRKLKDPTLLFMSVYPADPPYDELPIRGDHGVYTKKKIVQQVWDERYMDDSTPPHQRHALWRRHINAALYLKMAFDQSYGEDLWEFECDDSPFTFVGGKLQNDFQHVEIQHDSPRTPNLTMENQTDTKHWFLLPQTLFGFWDDIITDQIPKVLNAWSNRFQSQFENVTELAFCLGFVMTTEAVSPLNDDKVSKKKTKIIFRRRDRMGEEFETLLPFESHIIAYPDTETGIAVKHGDTFDNAETLQGKFDDFDATHTSAEKVDEIILNSRFTSNPYTVPQTANEPAKLEISMCFGDMSGYPGILYDWVKIGGSPVRGLIGWYMTGHPFYPRGSGYPGSSATSIWPLYQKYGDNNFTMKRTEDFPTLTPLISVADGAMDLNINSDTEFPVKFAPVMQASFQYTTADNKVITVVCRSYRQLLARYLTLFFSRPSAQIVRKYPTITQFRDKTSQKASWKNMKLYNTSKLPTVGFSESVLADYYVTGYTFEFNDCSTEVKYLPVSFIRPLREINFQDDTQFPPNPPPDPPVIDLPPTPSEPLCGVYDLIFSVELKGNCVAWVEFYIDGLFLKRDDGVDPALTGEILLSSTLHIDACKLSIGAHTITMVVVLCDGSVITANWNFNVVHGCC